MKKTIICLISAAMLIASCGHGNDNSRLEGLIRKEADLTNHLLAGKMVDQYTLLDSISFDGDNFIYNYTVLEDSTYNMESFVQYQDLLESNLDEAWRTDRRMKTLGGRIRKIDGKILYIYTGNTSGTTKSITINP